MLLEEAAQRECESRSKWKVQRKYGGIYKGRKKREIRKEGSD